MVADKLGCERAMIGTSWATSHPGCMDWLTKCYSHLVGGGGRFLARKAAWALSGCMTLACSLMSGHDQSHESAYRLEVNMGSVFEVGA